MTRNETQKVFGNVEIVVCLVDELTPNSSQDTIQLHSMHIFHAVVQLRIALKVELELQFRDSLPLSLMRG